MDIKLNNDMLININNEKGNGTCIVSLITSEEEIIKAGAINEEDLYEFLRKKLGENESEKAKVLAEIRTLKHGDKISVLDNMTVTFESYEETEDMDCIIWFTDDGLYKDENGDYRDLETKEIITDYIGNCTSAEYNRKVN